MRKSISLVIVIILAFSFSKATFADGNTYQVKKGDTLWTIAKKNSTTVNQLKVWNQLTSDKIKPKQVLKISAPANKTATPKKVASAINAAAYKEITVRATAYTASCKGCSGITHTGINLRKNPNAKVISVDPKIIPIGSKVYVPGYGEAIAADKGSSVRGNKIDVFIPNKKRALNWGTKTVNIKVYTKK